MRGALAGDVEIRLGADDTSLYLGQLVRVHIDVLVPALRLGDDWLETDPIDEDSPPRVLAPWLSGTKWLQPPGDIEEYLRRRIAVRGPGFLVNDFLQEDFISPIPPGFFQKQQRPVRFDRKKVTQGGQLYYRYRLTIPYRAAQLGNTAPVRARLIGSVFIEARPLGRRRVELVANAVEAVSNELKFVIKPVPAAGRPPYFTGAIGRFRIRARAEPTNVREGDPITYWVEIEGDGDLSHVAPPKLDASPGWDRFRVYEEPIDSGFEENRRYFAFRIRPLSATVEKIPPVLWSYFDPLLEMYQTVATESIDVRVEPVRVVSVAPRAERLMSDQEDAVRLAGNRPVDDLLADQGPRLVRASEILVVLFAPALALVAVITTRKILVSTVLSSERRARRRAIREARRLLRLAAGSSPEEAATNVSHAIGVLVTFGAVAGRGEVTADDLQRRSEADDGEESGWLGNLVGVLRECEAVRFGGAVADTEARDRWIAAVEQVIAHVAIPERSPTKDIVAAAVPVTMMLSLAAVGGSVTPARMREHLEHAERICTQAAESSGELQQRRRLYAVAAEEYEAVLASGLENGYLWFNLGNCYLHAGDLPRAVAAYERARYYVPRDPGLHRNLAAARQRLTEAAAVGFVEARAGFLDSLADSVLEVLSLRELELAWLLPWAGAWALILLASGVRFGPLRLWGTVLLLVALALATLHLVALTSLSNAPRAVILETVVLRQGPGRSYQEVTEGAIPAGVTLRCRDRVGQWWRVELAEDRTGWCPQDVLQIVVPPALLR